MRLAVWSGPRNLSTAMMYSFGNRPDCHAVDEPFYGAYLKASGDNHPMGKTILKEMETNPRKVAQNLTQYDTPIHYEKHMTHHMLDGFPMDWLEQAKHVFLIRHPARVLASYHAKRESPKTEDLGFVQQLNIYNRVRDMGLNPIIIDSADVRRNSKDALTQLCEHIGIDLDPAMLTWPAGPKPFDGPWAPHWYGSVHKSTGFSPETRPLPEFEPEWADLIETLLPLYQKLHDERTVRI